MAKRTNAERVHKWVALVDAIENGFASDVRKTEAVAVERDSADYSVHNSCGVRVLNCSEAKLIHDGNWASAHGQDVSNNAADAGGRALKGLNEAGMVVALDLEGDRPALADVNHAGVFAHANHEVLLHLIGDFLTELTKVNF